MSRKSIGWAVTTAGIIVVAIAALADQIGIGTSDALGWKQILGVVIGAVIAVSGFIIASRREKPADGVNTEA
jgi:uncharacterized membrane protein